MSLIVPGFTPRLLSVNYSSNLRHPPLGLCLHVAEGNGSLANFFNRSSTQASSTLWAGKNGQREQYVSADLKAWAQGAGNPDYLSIETEGYTSEPLTSAQLDTVATVMAWGHKTYGWPLVATDTPGASGLICHGYPTGTGFAGRPSWGGHPCPGLLRSSQRTEILRRAAAMSGQPVPVTPPSGDDEVAVLPTIRPGHDIGHPATEQLFCDLINRIQPSRQLDMSPNKAVAREAACKEFEAFFKIPGSVKSDGTGDGFAGPAVWRTLLSLASKEGH